MIKKDFYENIDLIGLESKHVYSFKDGSLGACLELTPLESAFFEDDQINSIGTKIKDFLNGLPMGLDIQFVQDVVGGNGQVLDRHLMSKRISTNLISELNTKRVEKFKSLDSEGLLPLFKLYIFIRQNFSESLITKKKFLSFLRKEKPEDEIDRKFTHELVRFNSTIDLVVNSLKNVGLESELVSSRFVLDMVFNQFNPDRGDKPIEYNHKDVRDAISTEDVVVTKTGFEIGTFHHRVITLKTLPDRVYPTMVTLFRELPFSSRLFLSINVSDQRKEHESLQLQRRIAFAMVMGKKGVSDQESEAKLTDIEGLLNKVISGSEKVFTMSCHVLLRSQDEAVLEEMVAKTLLTFRELSGAEAMVESVASVDIFNEMSLPNARSKERSHRVSTSVLAGLVPIYGNWCGHDNPAMLLRKQDGSLFTFDPFTGSTANANMVVSGGSGAGKSFFTNLVINQLLKDDPKVFIIDIGGSYQKTCESLGGQYINFGVNGELSINPFELEKELVAPSDSKIKFLTNIVELMTKEDAQSSIGKLERTELESAICEVYESNKNPSLRHLQQVLISKSDLIIKRIGRILSLWCNDTPYGKIVDRATSITFNKNIVCFDLKGLESYPDLQAVTLFLITDLVWRVIQTDRTTKKIVVFDECWKLLENEAGSKFIGEVFRTFRKYYASAVAISQTMDDFAKSKVSGAILPNSSHKWLLKQKGANFPDLKKMLSLSDYEIEAIQGLGQEKGSYSESFLLSEDKRQVVVIESTPLEYWLATTDPKDLAKLEEVKAQNKTLSNFDLLLKMAEIFPNGTATTH